MNHDHAQLLRQALEHHKAGRHADAEPLYQQAQALQPSDPETVHGLGFLRLHQRRLPEAIDLIGQAIALQPNEARYHHNLAEALRAARRYDEAVAAYRQALALRPYYPIALNNLGTAYLSMGRHAEAVTTLRQAIGLQPEFPEAHHNLGLAYNAQNLPLQAAISFRTAVEQRPGYMKACYSLINILQKLNRPDDAITCLQHALTQDPKSPAILNNLGIMYGELARYDEADTYLRRALAINPEMPEANANLANLLRRLPAPAAERKAKGAARAEAERLQTILELYRRALRRRPDYADALAGLAVAIYCQNDRFEDALAAAQKAIDTCPDDKENPWSYWNLSLLQLLQGDFEKGWAGAEVRLDIPSIFTGFPSKQPVWERGDLKGRTLLVVSEQGLGDYLQMARYVPLLADRGANVIVHARPPLVRLLRSVRGAAQVVPNDKAVPEHDLQVPMMSLPLRFKTRLETIPHDVPYLSAMPEDVACFHSLMAHDSGLKTGNLRVGLSWCGSPENSSNPYRSIPLEEMAPLAAAPNVTFYSLQKGFGEAELKNLPPEFRVLNLAPEIKDLADTAAAIMALDLVISVDTSVAHLAGALGKPVWTLLYHPPEWRWLRQGLGSPWYPTMRLFRQRERGDWEPLIKEVAAELAAWASRK